MSNPSLHHQTMHTIQKIAAFVAAIPLALFAVASCGPTKAAAQPSTTSVFVLTQQVNRSVPTGRLPFTACPDPWNCLWPASDPLSYQFPLVSSSFRDSRVSLSYRNDTSSRQRLSVKAAGSADSAHGVAAGKGVLLSTHIASSNRWMQHIAIRVKTPLGNLPVAYLPAKAGAWKGRITNAHPYFISRTRNPFHNTVGYLQVAMSSTATGPLEPRGIVEVDPGHFGRVAIKLRDYQSHHVMIHWTSDASNSRPYLVGNASVQKIQPRS